MENQNVKLIWAFGFVSLLIGTALTMSAVAAVFTPERVYLKLYLMLPLTLCALECVRQAYRYKKVWPLWFIRVSTLFTILHFWAPMPNVWAQLAVFVVNGVAWLVAYVLVKKLIASPFNVQA